MEIQWSTLVLQTINVLVLLWLLHRFLYKPVLKVLEQRQTRIAEQTQQAEAARQAAEAEKAEARRELETLAAQQRDSLARIQAEAEATRKTRMDAIEAEGRKRQQAAQEALNRERREAESQLRTQAARLATDFSRRILERLPSATLDHAYIDEVAKTLKSRADSGALTPPAEVRVVTAHALDAAGTGALTERFGALLPGPVQWQFEIKPELIAGLELHLDDLIIAHTLAGDLARLQTAVTADDHAH